MKKIWILIAIFVVLAGGIYLYDKKIANAPSDQAMETGGTLHASSVPISSGRIATTTASAKLNTTSNASKPNYSPEAHYSSGEDSAPDGSIIQVVEMNYTDQGFSPALQNINVGDYVFFKNKTSAPFLPVTFSDATHSAYAGFGPVSSVAAGAEYKFQFNKTGNFGIQNSLKTSDKAVVHVGK